MNRKHLITGGVLAVALAALLVMPAWLGAAEPAAKETTTEERPARGFLGVGLRQLTPELQTHFGAPEGSGVLVASVSDDSPATAAGIRVGDVITSIDGLAVDSTRDLSRELRHRPGESVAIELYRDGKPRQLTATLGERQTHGWKHGGRSPEEWAEFAERWERWGEEFGEQWGQWGEEFGQRWGEEFAESWGEEHAENWQSWAEEMAERGEGWEEMGEEIGRTVEKALNEVDWDEIGKAVEQSMKSLEEIDWEGMSEQIERRMEKLERHLEEQRQQDTDTDD
jgi:hypothetical protein